MLGFLDASFFLPGRFVFIKRSFFYFYVWLVVGKRESLKNIYGDVFYIAPIVPLLLLF